MVDLGGYVIILVETHDKKVKLYGKHNLYVLRTKFVRVSVRSHLYLKNRLT